VQRTFKVCDEALQSARLTASDVDAVILVGGPTRLPIVRNSVRHYFQKDPMTGVDPDEVVALGASIQARALLSTTAAEAGQASYLLDVTPLSLRVGTVGGFTEKIIDKNTPIPIEKSKTFTTSRDGQDRVKIRVYQGESNRAEGCELLGEFEFTGFRIGYRGEVQIQVTFEIDSNGIVNVAATDLETGQKTSTTINLSSGLSEQDLQKAVDDNAGIELARGRAA
jgi:molecular chaperone DnaK